MTGLHLLVTLAGTATRLRGRQAISALQRAAERNAAALTSIEAQLQRMSESPLRRGLQHLENAQNPSLGEAERKQYLSDARGQFEAASDLSPTRLLRTYAGLLCAATSLVLGLRTAAQDAARKACGDAMATIDEALAQPPPPPRPPSGWFDRFNWWFEKAMSDPDLTEEQESERDPWFAERSATLVSAVALLQTARAFADALGLGLPAGRPIRVLRISTYRDTRQHTVIIERYDDTFPAGTAQLRVQHATFHRHWPDTDAGTIEVRLTAVEGGRLDPSEILLGDPVPEADEVGWWPWTGPRADTNIEWYSGGDTWVAEFSPGGLPEPAVPMELRAGSAFMLVYETRAFSASANLLKGESAPLVIIAGCPDIAKCRRRMAVADVTILPGKPRLDSRPAAHPVIDHEPGIGPVMP